MVRVWILLTFGSAMYAQGVLATIEQGDLWLREVAGGAPKRVSTGGGSLRPRWSKSGTWLAFSKADQLWIVRGDGDGPRKVADNATRFVWSPAGDTLYFETSGGVQAASPGDWQPHAVQARAAIGSVSPDGRALAWGGASTSGPAGAGVPMRRGELLRLALDQGEQAPQTVLTGLAGEVRVYGWSPDSSRVLFWAAPEFSASLLADGASFQMAPAGGGKVFDTGTQVLLYPEFVDVCGNFVFVTDGGGRETWSFKRLARINLANNDVQHLIDMRVAVFSPACSPDAKQLAYVSGPDFAYKPTTGAERMGVPYDSALQAIGSRRIWLMGVDGLDPRQLTNDAVYHDERPVWSADGSRILFCRKDEQGNGSVWIMGRDGSAKARLSGALSLGDPYYGRTDWDCCFAWSGARR